jgi:hypothetical protein
MHFLSIQALMLNLLALAAIGASCIDRDLLKPPPPWVRNDGDDGDHWSEASREAFLMIATQL